AELVGARRPLGAHVHGPDALTGGPLDRVHELLAVTHAGTAEGEAQLGELFGPTPDLSAGRHGRLGVDVYEGAIAVSLALEAGSHEEDGLVVRAERGERVGADPGDAHGRIFQHRHSGRKMPRNP